jgi:phosphatidylethanolamine/phosphatidyl-N-methylethanolamine N-methyltransferase
MCRDFTMKQILRENFEFLRESQKRFRTAGAILPSSPFLARAITEPLRQRKTPKRVLEVGPGTGAVTRHIVSHIQPRDHLDLVEINARFGDLLRERFDSDPHYRRAAKRSRIHVRALQEFRAEQPYDVIVCCLPFNNFSAQGVGEVLDLCLSLLAVGGTLSFFEYMYVRPVLRTLANDSEKARFAEIDRLLTQRFQQHRFRRDWVFVNVPPAWVHHLSRNAA